MSAPSAEVPARGASSPPSTRTARSGRLLAIDLARGLAVLAMFASHIGPDPAVGGLLGWLMDAATGRSAALFALLAGFTLVILTGRPHPRTGRAGRQSMGRVAIRSAILVVLGGALVHLGTSIYVILAYYGVAFLLALPLYRLRAGTLAIVAAGFALVLPQIRYLLEVAADGGDWADTVSAHDPLRALSGSDGIVDLLVTGYFPALTWLPFIVAGMALARLDLSRPWTHARLALSGAALAVLGYGGSWLALHLVPGALTTVAATTDEDSVASAWWADSAGKPVSNHPDWLLVGTPHGNTTFGIVGDTGIALLVVAACLVTVERLPRLRRLAAPVIAVGTMSLTIYAGHIVAIRVLGLDDLSDAAATPVLCAFIAGAVLLAVVWTRFFRRGPLEYLVHTATTPARLIR